MYISINIHPLSRHRSDPGNRLLTGQLWFTNSGQIAFHKCILQFSAHALEYTSNHDYKKHSCSLMCLWYNDIKTTYQNISHACIPVHSQKNVVQSYIFTKENIDTCRVQAVSILTLSRDVDVFFLFPFVCISTIVPTTEQPFDPGDRLQAGHISSEFVNPGQIFFPRAHPIPTNMPSIAMWAIPPANLVIVWCFGMKMGWHLFCSRGTSSSFSLNILTTCFPFGESSQMSFPAQRVLQLLPSILLLCIAN